MLGLLRYAVGVSLSIAVFLAVGCGKPAEPSAPASPVRQVDTSTLPPLGEYTPSLDGGRIEMAGPAGWQLGARTKGYVVRFLGSQDDQYPMILVKAEDSSAAPLTSETVVAFSSALASDGSAQPVVIGKCVGALQVKRGKAPNTIDQILERLIFTTVLGGRKYMLELRTRQDRLSEHEDSLFAVAAGMRPCNTATEPNAATAEEDKAASQQRTPKKTDDENPATTVPGQKELDEIFE